LGLICDVGRQQVLQAVQDLQLAWQDGGIDEPAAFYKTEFIAGPPGITVGQTQLGIDLLKNEHITRNIFIKIAFNRVNSLLADGKGFPQ
jgi:hypothetical protein